jgi:CcmD family protein
LDPPGYLDTDTPDKDLKTEVQAGGKLIIQSSDQFMETYGKIFVVVAVLALILTGVFAYLFSLDKKIGKLEKEIREKENPGKR